MKRGNPVWKECKCFYQIASLCSQWHYKKVTELLSEYTYPHFFIGWIFFGK